MRFIVAVPTPCCIVCTIPYFFPGGVRPLERFFRRRPPVVHIDVDSLGNGKNFPLSYVGSSSGP